MICCWFLIVWWNGCFLMDVWLFILLVCLVWWSVWLWLVWCWKSCVWLVGGLVGLLCCNGWFWILWLCCLLMLWCWLVLCRRLWWLCLIILYLICLVMWVNLRGGGIWLLFNCWVFCLVCWWVVGWCCCVCWILVWLGCRCWSDCCVMVYVWWLWLDGVLFMVMCIFVLCLWMNWLSGCVCLGIRCVLYWMMFDGCLWESGVVWLEVFGSLFVMVEYIYVRLFYVMWFIWCWGGVMFWFWLDLMLGECFIVLLVVVGCCVELMWLVCNWLVGRCLVYRFCCWCCWLFVLWCWWLLSLWSWIGFLLSWLVWCWLLWLCWIGFVLERFSRLVLVWGCCMWWWLGIWLIVLCCG